MKLLKFPENPTDGQVAAALKRVAQATWEPYEMEESANPVQRFDDWLKPHMPRIEQINSRAWEVFWVTLGITGSVFAVWMILRS